MVMESDPTAGHAMSLNADVCRRCWRTGQEIVQWRLQCVDLDAAREADTRRRNDAIWKAVRAASGGV